MMIRPGDKLLLRSPNWLGDAVMTLPAIQQFTQAGVQLHVLCPTKMVDFWSLIPDIQSILTVQPKIRDTAKRLRAHHFDSAILFPNSLKTALEVWLARIPRRYGFHGHQRRWLLTRSWPRPAPTHGYVHQAKHNLLLLQQLGISQYDDIAAFRPIPKPAGTRKLASPYLALCPGAEYGPAKRWLTERYAAVVNQLSVKHDLPVVILGTGNDRNLAQQLTAQINRPVLDLAGQTTLAEFLAVLANAALALVNDSGAMHVAAIFGTPAVAIFGSTEPRLTGPLGNSVTVIREHVPCSPCFLRQCPLDNRCMTSISSEQVIAACETKL